MSVLREAQDLFVKSPPGGEAAADGGDPNLQRELTIDEIMFFIGKAGMSSGWLPRKLQGHLGFRVSNSATVARAD